MIKSRSHFVELIAQLPLAERCELIEDVRKTGLPFYARMTAEQRAQLDEGLAQADRGDIVNGDEALVGSLRVSVSSAHEFDHQFSSPS